MNSLSNGSNLFKGYFVNVDENDKRIIDNNELSEKRIEQHQAEEAKRLLEEREENGEGSSYDGFEAGIGYDQIDAYDDNQNIIGAPGPDLEDNNEFNEGFSEGLPEGYSTDGEYPQADELGQIQDNMQDGEAFQPGMDDLDSGMEGFDSGMEGFDGGMDAGNDSGFEADSSQDGAMDGSEDAPQINLEEIQAQIDEQIKMAEEQAQQIIADANAEAESIRNQAEEEGRNAGYEAGLAQGSEEARQIKEAAEAEMAQEKEKMEKDFKQLVNSIEPDMVEALTSIYEHVFNVEFRENKDIILHLIKTTLGKMDSGVDIIIHISSDDYDLVTDERASLEEAMTSPNASLEIIEDPLLKENECIIESEGGVFDCSLGVELSELSRKLKLLSYDRVKR